MTDLEKLKQVYDDIGIDYVCRGSSDRWTYMFLSGKHNADELIKSPLDYLLATHSFIEFDPNEKLASY